MPSSSPGMSSHSAGLYRRWSASIAWFALALAGPLAVSSATAATSFTEYAITASTLNPAPGTDFWISSAAPADVEGDGDLDLLVCGYFVDYDAATVEDRLTLYRNDGAGPAGSWALTAVPVDAPGLYFSAGDIAWADYDGDGDPDVVVGGRYATTLFRNDAGTLVMTPTVLPAYEERPSFLAMDQHSIAWGDFDNDGDPDLLVPSIVQDFAFVPPALLRNDGPGTGGAWTFTNAGLSLPIATDAMSHWGDMDGDGDLDLLFGNSSQGGEEFLRTYRNTGGTLAEADADLARINFGTADWGDADNDGDFDIVVAGNLITPEGFGETVVRVLFNQGGGVYTPLDVVHEFQSPEEPWLDFYAATWADYDSDGDVDLLVSGKILGTGSLDGHAEVYQNTGGTFALAGAPLPAPYAGNNGGAFTWFDVDGDGDLDYFVAGAYEVPGGNGLLESRAQLFRNDAAAVNAAPSAPTGLAVTPAPGGGVQLAWNGSTDDRTPAVALTYDLEVTPTTVPATPAERVQPEPGNVSRNHGWTLRGLAPGTYRWAVRAKDNAFNGSGAATGTFTIGTASAPLAGGPAGGLALSAMQPNPARGASRITLAVSRAQSVSVAVYDAMGREVSALHEGVLQPGAHTFALNAEALRAGVYLVRARGEAGEVSRRVTFVR